MERKTITIKIGGEPANNESLLADFAAELSSLGDSYHFVIIHGGGDEVSAMTRHFGIEPVFKDGVRMTSADEMKFVDMVLCGQVNKRLVRLFQKAGFNAVGLSGSDGRLFTGKSVGGSSHGIGKNGFNHTGRISNVNVRILQTLLDEDYLPVISSTSMDDDFIPLNINADAAAFEIASAARAHALLFLSDIPGILKNGKVLVRLRTEEVLAEINHGTISGGMIPKVKSSIDALERGVSKIIIGEYKAPGSLALLLNGESGTQIV